MASPLYNVTMTDIRRNKWENIIKYTVGLHFLNYGTFCQLGTFLKEKLVDKQLIIRRQSVPDN